jgi:hypothetical protein
MTRGADGLASSPGRFAWLSAALTLMAAILMAISPNVVLDTIGPFGKGRISLPNPLGV